MHTRVARLAVSIAVSAWLASGCLTGPDSDADSSDQAEMPEVAGTPADINIGFDGAAGGFGVRQFEFFPVFFSASAIHPGPRLCHTYVVWNIADEPAAIGDATSPAGHRAAFEYWLQNAQAVGRCEEVLISFKGDYIDADGNTLPGVTCPDGQLPPCNAIPVDEVATAFRSFQATDWQTETGYIGTFAFTPWNEPQNETSAGNGLGKPIPAATAARYFLAMDAACNTSGTSCKVAAGDLASNGEWGGRDFAWNCADDNVAGLTTQRDGAQYCVFPSSRNPANRKPASYLDLYKHTIAQDWAAYPGATSRPKYFAYHGWHDINDYIERGNTCSAYDDCDTRQLLLSLGGSWGGVTIWDTEVGASQGADLGDVEQARAAALLVRISALSRRIQRIYYTRLYNDGEGTGGELVRGADPMTATGRAALDVLARRETHVR